MKENECQDNGFLTRTSSQIKEQVQSRFFFISFIFLFCLGQDQFCQLLKFQVSPCETKVSIPSFLSPSVSSFPYLFPEECFCSPMLFQSQISNDENERVFTMDTFPLRKQFRLTFILHLCLTRKQQESGIKKV